MRDHRLSAGVWSALLSSQPACAALTHPAALLQPHNPLRAQNQVRTSRLFRTLHFICIVTFFAYIEDDDDLTGLEYNIVCTFSESISILAEDAESQNPAAVSNQLGDRVLWHLLSCIINTTEPSV